MFAADAAVISRHADAAIHTDAAAYIIGGLMLLMPRFFAAMPRYASAARMIRDMMLRCRRHADTPRHVFSLRASRFTLFRRHAIAC